jgi:hypothetical protein
LFIAFPAGAADQVIVNAFGSPGSQTDFINLFELFNNGLYWTEGSADCSVEFKSFTKIGNLGVLGATPLEVLSDCTVVMPGITRDDSWFFYSNAGRLWRKAANSSPSDAPQEIPAPPFTPLGAGMEMGAMMNWNGRIYWSDTTSGFFDIMSVNADTTGSRYELLGTGNKIVKLMGYTYTSSSGFLGSPVDAFFILTAAGVLMRYDVNPRAASIVTLATGVTDFAIREESFTAFPFFSRSTAVYAAIGQRTGLQPTTPPGKVIRINAASGATSVVYNAQLQNQVTSIAVDVNNLYLVEQPIVGCGELFGCLLGTSSSLRRQQNPANNGNSSNPWDLIDFNSSTIFNLRSDTQWLYFIVGTQILRVRTDAPALQIDVKADALEVVQTVQNLQNDVRLVANKPTFVRGYAHLTVNTTGLESWFPGAHLRGFLNGSELPGSPLWPINYPSVTTDANLGNQRSNVDSGFLFQLPKEWVQPGQLQVSLIVDPNHTIPETGGNPFANNTVSTANLTVVKKGSPCLVFVPLWSEVGEYDPLAPGSRFQDLLTRTKSLMPVEDFRVFFAAGRVDKPVVSVEFHPECFLPFTFCSPVQVKITPHPFSMPNDKNWALFWTAVFNALHQNPSGCNDTHWVGTFPANIPGGFNGIGGATGVKVGDLVDLGVLNGISIPSTPLDSTVVVRMDPGQGNANVVWDRLNGGHTLAHELGHNYGRFHIDQTLSSTSCGSQKPDRPWQLNPPYPFDPCTISSGNYGDAGTFFGFDTISRVVVPPDMAGDTMSYADSHWTSKPYWDALLGAVTAAGEPDEAAAPFLAAAQNPSDRYLLLGGQWFFNSNTVEWLPAHVLPTGMFDPNFLSASLSALTQLPPAFPYRVRLVGAADQVLADQPIRFLAGIDQGADSAPFLDVLLFPLGTQRIQLWNGSEVVGEQVVSVHPPQLQLGTPIYHADTRRLELSWTAADPDGDPLMFLVLYTQDNGATWQVIDPAHLTESIEVNADLLPGGSQARLRVVATDGANSTSADTTSFTVPAHAPIVVISGLVPGQRLPFGQPATLTGLAYQPEYGTLESSLLAWTLTGPQSSRVSGSTLSLAGLAPGTYLASLVATGQDLRVGSNSLTFAIHPLPVPETSVPTLDGWSADQSYVGAPVISIVTGPNTRAQARVVHANGFLYLAADNLPYGNGAKAQFAFRVDTLGDRAATAQADEIGFLVNEDGISAQELATGGILNVTLQPGTGLSVFATRGQNSWTAEMRIADTLLGGWNHVAGVMLGVTTGASASAWPPNAGKNAPVTWAAANFGNVPAPTNRPPVALAGAAQQISPLTATPVTLDGSGSYDPDGDALTYAWTQLDGPSVTLAGASTARASFTVNPVVAATTMHFRLVVQDGAATSAPADVAVAVLPATFPPSANGRPGEQMGPDGVFHGSLATLGSAGIGTRFEIQASSNLVDWVSIGTNSLNFFQQIPFVDARSGQYRWRFYRAHQLARQTTQVYSNDFEGAVGSEWSVRTTDVTPVGARHFLGQFGNGGPRLQLIGLPAHNRVRVECDVYLIRSWDGNDPVYGPDALRVSVANGPLLLDATFACSISQATQTYPDAGASGNPPLTGAVEHGTLGYSFADFPGVDAVYHFRFTFDHTDSSLAVDFAGTGLQELTDESWGLDNVKVTVEEDP